MIDVRTSAQSLPTPAAVSDDADADTAATNSAVLLPRSAAAQHPRRAVPPDVAPLLVVAEAVADVGRHGVGGEGRRPVRPELPPLVGRQGPEGVGHE